VEISYLKQDEIPTNKAPIYYAEVEFKIQGKKKTDVKIETMLRCCKGRTKEEVKKNLHKKLIRGDKKKDYQIIKIVLLEQLGFGVID
jgi:hypothetical protein